MLAGLLIAACMWFFMYGTESHWMPHIIVPVAIVSIGIFGIMWLYDEINP
jgi:hypothetical protein